jgi:hypothetical protein
MMQVRELRCFFKFTEETSSSFDVSSVIEGGPSSSASPAVTISCEITPKTALRISITNVLKPQQPLKVTRPTRIQKPAGTYVTEATIEVLRQKEAEQAEKKRKKVADPSSKAKKAKFSAASASKLEAAGKTWACENNPEKETDESCWICAGSDPPDGGKGELKWLQCGNQKCERWYHEYCVRDRPKAGFCLFGHKTA